MFLSFLTYFPYGINVHFFQEVRNFIWLILSEFSALAQLLTPDRNIMLINVRLFINTQTEQRAYCSKCNIRVNIIAGTVTCQVSVCGTFPMDSPSDVSLGLLFLWTVPVFPFPFPQPLDVPAVIRLLHILL